MTEYQRRLYSLQESERIAGYRPGERFAEIRSAPFEPTFEGDEPFDYCLWCNGRYTDSSYFPYCGSEHALAAEKD